MFAVGTSSTGMPLLPDNPMTRPRAPARNEFPRPHLKVEKTRPPLQHRPSLPVLSRVEQRVSGEVSGVGPSPLVMSRSHSALDKEIEESKDTEEEEEEEDRRSSTELTLAMDAIIMVASTDNTATSPPTSPRMVVTDYGSKESDAFPAAAGGSGSGALSPEGEGREARSAKSSFDSVMNQMRMESFSSLSDLHARKFSTEQAKKYSIFNPFAMPNLRYDIKDYSECGIDIVEDLGTWDFPIFRFSEDSNGHPLSQVCVAQVVLQIVQQ